MDLNEALDKLKSDPVRGFVMIPVIGARPPNKGILVSTKGQTLLLPDWSNEEWLWYLQLSLRIADSLDTVLKGDESIVSGSRDKKRARGKVAGFVNGLLATTVAQDHPTPATALAMYMAAVKLVIAAVAISTGPTVGDLVLDSFKAAFKEAPARIGAALATALGVGGEVLIPAFKAAGDILAEIFEQAVKSLFIPIAIGLGLWWAWNKSKKQSNRDEE